MSPSAPSNRTDSTEDSAYTIPPLCDDVINAIIDCVDRNPVDDLATCSQVCRAWTHRSQTHLLRNIDISNENRLTKFISALPTLSERVRNLMRLVFIRVSLPSPESDHAADTYKLGLTDTITLLEALPCLDSLILSGVQLEAAVEDPLRQLMKNYLSCRKPIQLLSMDSIRSSSSIYLAEIATYMALFQSVSSLTISHCDKRLGLQDSDDFTSILRNLPTSLPLCINAASIDGPVSLIRLLHALGVANNLRSLEFHCHLDVIVAVEELLTDNPGGISVLKIIFTTDSDEHEHPGLGRYVSNVWSIDASTLTNLREIELTVSLDSDSGIVAESIVMNWNRMVDILRHLSAAPVESIVMWLFWGSVNAQSVIHALRALPWADLDVVLQRYKTLNKPLTLTLHADCDISRSMARQWMEIIEEGLPSLKTRIGEARKVCLVWMYWDDMSLLTVDWDVLKTESVQAQS